jgi:hypothetical protein
MLRNSECANKYRIRIYWTLCQMLSAVSFSVSAGWLRRVAGYYQAAGE